MGFIKTIAGGTLFRDPEVNYSSKGMAVCKFALAVERPKKEGQAKAEVDFFNFTAFGKLGETIGNNYAKGSYILVKDCRPQNDSYVGKDGVKKTSFGYIVTAIEFTEGKKQGNTQSRQSSMADFGDELDF